MNTEKEIDKVLSLLGESGNKIKENVLKLSNEVSTLERTIESDTKESFTKIKDSLSSLKNKIQNSTSQIENIEEKEYIEKSKLLSNYYETIIKTKNDLMNFNISNIDDVYSSLDIFTNENKNIIKIIENTIDDKILSSASLINRAHEIIANPLIKYSKLLTKYQEELSSTFSKTEANVKSVLSLYISSLDEYKNKVDNIKKVQNECFNSIFSNLPELSDIFNNDSLNLKHIIDNDYVNKAINAKKEYDEKKKQIQDEFLTKENKLIERIKYILLSSTDINDLLERKNFSIKDLHKDILDKDNISDFEKKMIIAKDDDELDEVITLAFKNIEEENFTNYKKQLDFIESEYYELSNKYDYAKLFGCFLSTNNHNLLDIFTELNKKEFFIEYEKMYKKCIHDRLSALKDLAYLQNKIISSLNKIVISFNYQKNIITSSFNKELKDELYVLKKELNILKIENEFINDGNIKLYNDLQIENKKSHALLEYELNTTKLHRKYIKDKCMYKLAYELTKKERDIDLVNPRFMLDKIVNEYDVIKSSYKAIFDSETEMLLKTKERNEVMNLSVYEYAYSMFRHRILVSNQMLDMARCEYELRINVLNEIRTSSIKYSKHQIERSVNDYLSSIDKINNIKNIELNNILDRLDKFESNNKREIKLNDRNETTELLKILDDYKASSDHIMSLMKNDSYIKHHETNVLNLDNITIENIDKAQKLRDSSISVALSSLEKSNQDLINVINTLNDESINYHDAYESYIASYTYEKNRIDSDLENDSKPYLDQIQKINENYHNDYLIKYEELDKEHNELTEKYYKELLDEYMNIDKECYIENISNINLEDVKVTKIEAEINNYNLNIEANKNLYRKNIEDNEKDFNKNNKLNDKYELISNKNENKAYKKTLRNYNLIINDINKINNRSIKELKKFLLSSLKPDLFTYEAILEEYNNNISKIRKDLKKKHKKDSLKDLIN